MNKSSKIVLEEHNGIIVLRDDLLIGGTKSILMPSIIGEAEEYVYASPVYGGFQIALSAYCQSVGKRATIFCAKRGKMHENTKLCMDYGAKIMEIPYGYLTVVEKHSKDYCEKTGSEKIVFGANSMDNKILIADRMRDVIDQLGREPKEIFCAVGSGTLVDSILMATTTSKVYGVEVGAEYKQEHERLKILKYPKKFDQRSSYYAPFQSMPNYDLKAWEFCNDYKMTDDAFFWNVL